jgi:integrase
VFTKEWDDGGRKYGTLGHPLQINNLGQREFARLIAAAKVKPITLHGLRHTCATLLLSAGTPPNVVQQRLGHKRIEITLSIYAHVLPGQQRDAARRLSSLLYGR